MDEWIATVVLGDQVDETLFPGLLRAMMDARIPRIVVMDSFLQTMENVASDIRERGYRLGLLAGNGARGRFVISLPGTSILRIRNDEGRLILIDTDPSGTTIVREDFVGIGVPDRDIFRDTVNWHGGSSIERLRQMEAVLCRPEHADVHDLQEMLRGVRQLIKQSSKAT